MTEVKSGFEISTKNYDKAARTLASLAHNITHTSVPGVTIHNWEQMMYAIRIGDDRVDKINYDVDRAYFKRQLMGFLRNEPVSFSDDAVLEGAMVNLKRVCDSLPDERQALLLGTLDRLLRVTELVRETPDINQFSSLTRLEGQITSRLFLSVLPEEYGNLGTRRRLCKTFTRFGRFADVSDSFADLPDDYAEGLTKVNPSFVNRGRLLISSLSDVIAVLLHVRPTINLIGQIGMRTMETLQNNPHR